MDINEVRKISNENSIKSVMEAVYKVIDKIAKVENIDLERADLDKKFAELSAAYRISQQDLYKQISKNPEILSSLSQQAMNDKVRDFLLKNNTVNIVEKKKSSAKKASKKVEEN